jgi:GTP diphosphokinase / guanosine-3',5'-bis(diphosphate) 3'-diphosphatase
LRYFKKLHREIKKYLNPKYLPLIEKAFVVAEQAHEKQTRHTGEPYITHPVAVATILAQMRLDHQTIIAALLHDVLEDTDFPKSRLAKLFGKEVAELVDGVSKLTKINFETKAQAQAENFRKMMMAMAKDIRVIIVKLADRLHNMRTLDAVPQEKQRRVAKETLDIFAPIANRLGMHSIRLEYEELGFAAIYPSRYRILKRAIKNSSGNRKGVVSEIQQKLKARLKDCRLKPFIVQGREKHLYSIFKKMRKKNVSFSEVMDIYGFRVVVDSVDMCYRVLGALHNLYKPLPQRFKDYIAIPKANGYQSLHTTLFGPYGVPLDIQIRTHKMDQTAENGIAAHWLYKSSEKNTQTAHLRAREWIKNMIEMQKSTGNSLEFIENVKTDLFPNEVYVFTPRGNILELPRRATPIDFAYAIHSDIGNTCITAKVNRKVIPLSTPLKSGQTVEVITSKHSRPNPAWLDFVVTGKAKSNIRHHLKVQRKNESSVLGQRLFEQAVFSLDNTLKKIKSKSLQQLVKQFKLASEQEMYAEVGLGSRMASVAAQQYIQLLNPLSQSELTGDAAPLVIKGTEGVVLHYAKCCQPLPGESISGFLDSGKGIFVHLDVCEELHKLQAQHADKIVFLSWQDDVDIDMSVSMTIEVLNKSGLLADVSSALGALKVNIHSIYAKEVNQEYGKLVLTVTLHSQQHLERLSKRLLSVDGVEKVYRSLEKF